MNTFIGHSKHSFNKIILYDSMARSYRFYLLGRWGQIEPLQCIRVPILSDEPFIRQALSIISDTCLAECVRACMLQFLHLWKCVFESTEEKWKKALQRSHHLSLDSLNFISKSFIGSLFGNTISCGTSKVRRRKNRRRWFDVLSI